MSSLPIVKHLCSNCGVEWHDNGPRILFCYSCNEELR